MNRNRIFLTLGLAALLVATVPVLATASEGESCASCEHKSAGHGGGECESCREGGHGRGHGHGEWMEHRLDKMSEHLELTESQRAQIEALMDARKDEMEARREEFRARHEAMEERMERIHEMADAPNPDATAIGNLVIEIHRERAAMKAHHDEMTEEIKAVLTDEQRVKFEAFQDIRHDMRDHHRGRGRGRGRS